MSEEPAITLTDAPDPADTAVITDGLRAYNVSQSGYDDYRPLAIFVSDPGTGKVVGGLYGASSRGQLRIDRFFLPENIRRNRLGARLLALAEEEGRRRGCAIITLFTLHFQAPGFYRKQGYTEAARLTAPPPGAVRHLMMKSLI
jgi:GNAT superfamily N-acetyltransferase